METYKEGGVRGGCEGWWVMGEGGNGLGGWD